ncbi:MAG: ABC transporter substrate-binding protein [Bacteroidota bacterium]
MNIKSVVVWFLILPLLAVSCQQGGDNKSTEEKKELRIISLSGFLTETLFDLGLGEQIVGRDITSTYPSSINEVPALGHVSRINVEAVIGLNPDFVIAEEDQYESYRVLKQIEEAGINVLAVPTSTSLQNALHASTYLSQHMPVDKDKIAELEEKIIKDSLALAETLATFEDEPQVLFIYARGAGRLMVGGKNTGASAMIKKAGGVNAIQSFDDYVTLTPESLLEANPDVILMFTSGIASLDGKEGLVQIKGISQTPAFQHDRIVAMDGHYLVSFCSRAGQAAKELAQQIHLE